MPIILFCAALLVAAAQSRGEMKRQEPPATEAIHKVGNELDISAFALLNASPGEVWFEEPRDIERVVVDFRGAVPRDVGLSYYVKFWPRITRVEELEDRDACGLGWACRVAVHAGPGAATATLRLTTATPCSI